MKSTKSSAEVGQYFSDKWWGPYPEVYEDLMTLLDDPNHIPSCKPHQVNRGYLTCDYVLKNVPKGGRILDMACGMGFNSHCLTSKGYETMAFDMSKKGISRAREKANELGQNPDSFFEANQNCMDSMKDESFDAILAMGFFRYISQEEQQKCYRNVHRLLKPKGKLLITHQNILFEMFALNEGTLKFWADVIDNYSDARDLLGGQSVLEALEGITSFKERQFDGLSASKDMPTEVENPLTYESVAAKHGFMVEKITYPASHILPPQLERMVDQDKLFEIKRNTCLTHTEDWRAMFMEFEFLAFTEKMQQ